MMKYKPVKHPVVVQKSQQELDREEFERHYNAWRYETIIHSSTRKIFGNQHFHSIMKMGKRAVPFIYEIIKKQEDFVVHALPEIYQCNISEPGKFIGITKICELWTQKLE